MARIALVHDIAGVAAVQAQLLRGAGHDVDQIELPSVGASWRWPVKAVALPARLAAFLPVARRIRQGRYDVVHIHFLSQGVVGLMAGTEFFVQAHGSDLHVNLANRVYRVLTRAVLDRAKKVFYVTPNLAAYLAAYKPKLVYLPNPVDMRGVPIDEPPPSQVERVLIFTRLHRVKGVDSIFPAVERLSKQVEVTALDYGPLAPEYMRRYGRWVKFVKPVPHGEVGRFVSGFDAVIGQQRQGVLGLMEIETLAAGRPVITAVDGRLYPEDPPPVIQASGPDEIVAAVEKLRARPEVLADLVAEGKSWALRNHGYGHHLELLQKAYFGASAAEPRSAAT
jgi:glycosyltransferase involved in cell wall biosynthesis